MNYDKLAGRGIFIDVATLLETSWTGISYVTAHLAREIYARLPLDTFLFVGERVIDPSVVMSACMAPGGYMQAILANGYGDFGHISSYLSRRPESVGLFPNIKTAHGIFDREIVIFHDLSAMLMPELHQGWAAHVHTKALAEDSRSSDLICCVSEATRRDAEIYLPHTKGKTFVSHLGVNPVLRNVNEERLPFVLVLGTIEPRKNLALVAEYMAGRPSLASRLTFVFVGRPGWGAAFETIFSKLLSDSLWKDRIVFTGYLGEGDKWALLRRARFAVFPSLFEGFGLPVLECMAAGCPVLTSRSSSLMEFENEPELYFDPFSVAEFSKAFRFLDGLSDDERGVIGERMKVKAEQYTWGAFAERILTKASERF